ncbi:MULTISPECIES: luciferase family protein, partial [unclassified Streptomyces]|uniref:luciferase domain-containing protein n=1 Tax=unclassified Streptomyces TaxID=2593676 RepID=UPI0004C5CB8F
MDLAEHADARLAQWSVLTRGSACCERPAPGLCAGGREIVRFPGGNTAQVHLTTAMIERLRPALRTSTAVNLGPAPTGWVAVRLETGSDIDLLATLVSAALLAAERAAD